MALSKVKTSEPVKVSSGFNSSIFKSKPKLKDITLFCRQFATILQAGINITRALDIIAMQTQSKPLAQALRNVVDEVSKGKSLSDALESTDKAFPEFMVNMVRVGELSGNLDNIMASLADYYEKDNRIKKKVKSSMTYPAALFVIVIAVSVFLIKMVVPTFVGMLTSNGGEIPGPTALLLNISNILEKQGILILTVLLLLAGGIAYFSKTDSGRHFFGELVFKIPVLGNINQKVVAARFSRTMSLLLTSGLPIVRSIEIVQTILGNVCVSDALDKAIQEVKKGRGFADPIAQIKYFPLMMSQMIIIGEETGSVDSMLVKTANIYDEEVDNAVTQATTLLEPIIIVFAALLVGFIVIAMLLPMFKMYSALSAG